MSSRPRDRDRTLGARRAPAKRAWALVLPLAVGCGASRGDADGPAPSPKASSSVRLATSGASGTSGAPTAPAASPDVCQEIIDRYRGTLRTATGRCTSDAGCKRFGGVDPDAICGGVTDAKTAHSLQRISEELDAARCPRQGYSCPAIDPRCVDGACR